MIGYAIIGRMRKMLLWFQNFTKQRIVFTWLASYALVLLVPLSISSIIYIKTVRVVEDDIINSNQLFLKRANQHMDGLIRDAKRLSQELALNPQINEVFKANNSQHQINPYNLFLTIEELQPYTILNNSVEDFYIYSKDSDLVLSSYNSSNSKLFFEAYIRENGISYRDWYRLLTEYHQGDFIPITYYFANQESRNKIAFVRTIKSTYRSNVTFNIIIILDELKFIEDAQDIWTLNKGTVLLLDKHNKVVSASRAIKTIPEIDYNRLTGDNGLFHTKINGKKVIVSYITSQLTQWKYITVIPNSLFWQKAGYVRNLTYFNLVFCLLIGGIITFFVLQKNYNPVRKLIELLEKYPGLSYDKMKNEYQFIEQAIDKAHTDLEKSDRILNQQNMVLRSHFLTRLLLGKVDDREIAERLSLYDIKFNSDCFVVMAFYITDIEIKPTKNVLNQKPIDTLEKFKHIQAEMMTDIIDIIGEKNQGYAVDVDNLLICLVNLAEDQIEEAKQEITRIAAAVQQRFSAPYQIHLTVASSSIHYTVAGIPAAYHEALQAMEYKRLLGIDEVIHFEDLDDLPKGGYYYPFEKEYQLINCIKTGDSVQAGAILNEIFRKNFENMVLPMDLVRCLMFNLVGTVIKTLNEVSYGNEDGFLEKLRPVEKLLGCESISEMQQQMIRLIETVCGDIERKRQEKKYNQLLSADFQLAEKSKEYIHQNYRDQNMNITAIAGHFKINPVILSRIFTEQTGEGLLDYINRTRIKKAEELIKMGAKNLDEVAKATGYSSTRTFTRAFKKYEGVTPGKFKEAAD